MNDMNERRAKLYRFFGRLFRAEIDAETLTRLKAARFPEDGPWTGAGARWNECAAALTEADLEPLAVDFARVFLGAGLAEAAAAFPYESVYTSPKRIIMQDAWSRMRELLRSRKLEIALPSADLMEDHASVELEYMAWLCGNAEIQEQAEFYRLHLANWLPRFGADVEQYAETALYRAAAALLPAFLAFDGVLIKQLSVTGPEETKTETPVSEAMPAAARKGVSVTGEELRSVFSELGKTYDIYGPADGAELQIADEALLPFFDGAAESDYVPAFVEKNARGEAAPRRRSKGIAKGL